MEDLNGLEAVIRRIAREEITRAMGAAGAVAEGAMEATGGSADISRGVLVSVMERVARDVLANVHPALAPEHTASTPSTEPVHTITAVPERPRATCTCHRHTHVMGYENRCGAAFCYCLSPVRARAEHTDVHASTEAPRTCSVCEHGEHDQGKCAMHVYRRGEAVPCPCLASRTVRSTGTHNPGCGHAPCDGWTICRSTDRPADEPSTPSSVMCTVCEHAPHGAGNCSVTIPYGEAAFQCTCTGVQASRTLGAQRSTRPNPMCTVCEHAPHGAGDCPGIVAAGGACTCSGKQDVHVVSTAQARKCSLCLHPEHDQSRCPYAVASGTCLCTGRASTSACSYCNHDHGGPLEDCPARVGKQQCSCPYVGGRR